MLSVRPALLRSMSALPRRGLLPVLIPILLVLLLVLLPVAP
jgi:hypothetical protein